jgi:CRP-like cAMP-binding protein
LNSERPNVAAALWRETLIDAAIFREWINVGRRSAVAKMAHLFAELYRRLEALGRTKDGVFQLPITQVDLEDCLGLSTVHVNRVLQDLRRDGLLRVNRADFHLLERTKLEHLAGFEATYLHQHPGL